MLPIPTTDELDIREERPDGHAAPSQQCGRSSRVLARPPGVADQTAQTSACDCVTTQPPPARPSQPDHFEVDWHVPGSGHFPARG